MKTSAPGLAIAFLAAPGLITSLNGLGLKHIVSANDKPHPPKCLSFRSTPGLVPPFQNGF